jgi:hypothetical protein
MSSTTDGKKTFEVTPDKLNKFYGLDCIYEPQFKHYSWNKVGYGIWDFTIKKQKGEVKVIVNSSGIYRNGFIDFLVHHGFYKLVRPDSHCILVRCHGNLLEEIEILNISDFLIEYLTNNGNDINYSTIINEQEIKVEISLALQQEIIKRQCNSLFNKKFLELLPTFNREILKDTSTECYKLFSNKAYKISAEQIESLDYATLENKCVWKKHVVNFHLDISSFEDCHFAKFINNVSNAAAEPDRNKAFISAIGYLLHKYNPPQKGQAVICYDETITDIQKPEGGTGKGIFAKALSKMCEMVTIDGKKFDEKDRFCFQRISDSTQIAFFDDVKKKLAFDRFNSLLTDGLNVEKKNQDEFYIQPEDCPKFLLTSNSILECEGATRRRRQFPLEFSDFYSKMIINGNEEPVKKIHGSVFFSDDWNQREWQMFYSFLINSIQEYLRYGLHTYELKNVNTNRLRQVTTEDFAEWVNDEKFEFNKKYEIKPYYESFKALYYPDDEFSQKKFTSYLKWFAVINNAIFKQPKPSNGKTFFTLLKDSKTEK